MCDTMRVQIVSKSSVIQDKINAFRGQTSTSDSTSSAVPHQFSREAFIDGILEWIIADDQVSDALSLLCWLLTLTQCQSINVIENPQLRSLFRLLRSELRDEDIPHRTTLRNRITEVFGAYLDHIEKEMKVTGTLINCLVLRFIYF